MYIIDQKNMSSENGLFYGGWSPLGSDLKTPPPVFMGHHYQTGSYFEKQQEEVIWYPEPIPLDVWQEDELSERQQLGGIFPFQLTPQDIALGGIVLSLLVTVLLGLLNEKNIL